MMATLTFVDPAAANVFNCPICLHVFTDPVQFDCNDGHVFCKRCITRVPPRNGHKRCPLCRQECKQTCYYHKIPFVERQIKSLMVRCPNHQITTMKARYLERKRQCMQSNMQPPNQHENDIEFEDGHCEHHRNHNHNHNNQQHPHPDAQHSASAKIGQKRKRMLDHTPRSKRRKSNDEEVCQWIGEYCSLPTHHQQCPLQLVRCTYCREQLMRRDQQQHVSNCPNFPVECSRCHVTLQRRRMADHAAFKCPSQIIACVHCGESMRRWKMRAHLHEICKENIVGCERYQRFGCTERFKRKHSAEHETQFARHHLELVTKGYFDLEGKYIRLLSESAAAQESQSENEFSESESESQSSSESRDEESEEDSDEGQDDDQSDESEEDEDSDVDEYSDY